MSSRKSERSLEPLRCRLKKMADKPWQGFAAINSRVSYCVVTIDCEYYLACWTGCPVQRVLTPCEPPALKGQT
jgi:hypothetical protein